MTSPPVHRCPAPGCTVELPQRLLACRPHWYSVPKELRDRLWQAYSTGGRGSIGHIRVVGEVVTYLRAQGSK